MARLPDADSDFMVGSLPLPNLDQQLLISWGSPVNGCRNAVMETGFFWDAAHIDTVGLYRHSSLNTIGAITEIEAFEAPAHACDLVLKQKRSSKYPQTNKPVNWDGVVLACQQPGDRSVLCGGSAEEYFSFVEGACKKYKKNLFLKLHPWNSSSNVVDRLTQYANENGCRIQKTDHSVITNCKFVLVWNSTFGMDCFIRDVPVAQFAPGYWHMTDAVTYTAGEYPDSVNDTLLFAHQLADFVIHRYCFRMDQSTEQWSKMLKFFAGSRELFPLKPEFSYASSLDGDLN